MAGAVAGMAGKILEVECAVGAAHELRAPGFEIAYHVDDVVDPDARELRNDQFAAVLQDVRKMQLGAVIPAHSGGEAAARHRGRATGGAALGDLNDPDARFRAFERGHGAGGPAADDQNVSVMANQRDFRADLIIWIVHWPCIALVGVISSLAISTNASTQASAKAASLTCSASSSMRALLR